MYEQVGEFHGSPTNVIFTYVTWFCQEPKCVLAIWGIGVDVLGIRLKNSDCQITFFQLMFSATDRGHTEIVKLLLENGANFMISTEAGLHGTALHSAAAKGRLECVRWSIFFF